MSREIQFAVLLTVPLLPLSVPLCAITAPQQPLELASPFVDDMILQREMQVPVWGWAKPGSQITVAFAGQDKTATASEKGKWMLKLDPLTASSTERKFTVGTADGVSSSTSGQKACGRSLQGSARWQRRH